MLWRGGALASAVLAAGCPPENGGDAGDGSQESLWVDPHPGGIIPDMPETLRKLVSRATFGINAYEADLALSLGYDDYLEYHLNHEAIDDSALDNKLAPMTTLNMSPLEFVKLMNSGSREPLDQFYHATYLRRVYSRRQLYERMVEFWTNHFNIFIGVTMQRKTKPIDDRDVIRRFALDTFPNILSASAHSPAMILYLDNYVNVKGSPNQNYARELLELHCMGPDNYTIFDIEEVARCFTGWNFYGNLDDHKYGEFRFRPELHDNDEKTVLGVTIPAGGGVQDGQDVLDIISLHPAYAPLTAQFLGRKIAVQFWGYNPPQALVDDIASAYLSTDGDIKAMVRAALQENWIASAPPKLKRPFHFVASALRKRRSRINNVQAFRNRLRAMGNHPYDWIPPNGYPDDANFWGRFIMSRWDSTTSLVAKDWNIEMDLTPWIEAETAEDVVDLIDGHFFGGTMTQDERAAVLAYASVSPEHPNRRRLTVGLALASPTFQWY
jgi:hypothetical protein